MPSDRTVVSELSTALGMVGEDDLGLLIDHRPMCLASVGDDTWDLLRGLHRDPRHAVGFAAGFENGRAFLRAPDALAGRRPRLIEWTAGRNPPGDEVVPSDLRVDHVYMISCKYLSRILHNPSPARLVDGLLTQRTIDDRTDWYERVAPQEHQALYELCVAQLGLTHFPARAVDLTKAQRVLLAKELAGTWSSAAAHAYGDLCRAVSDATARQWRATIAAATPEQVLWRLLRIGSAPYFVLGTDGGGFMRLRVDTPWDWRRRYRLRRFAVTAQVGGQPRVGWSATYETRSTGVLDAVKGHIEVRWSHGRFGQRPEAKVYLDTNHEDVPGYHRL